MVVARWTGLHGPKRHGGAGISPTGDEEELVLALIESRCRMLHLDFPGAQEQEVQSLSAAGITQPWSGARL